MTVHTLTTQQNNAQIVPIHMYSIQSKLCVYRNIILRLLIIKRLSRWLVALDIRWIIMYRIRIGLRNLRRFNYVPLIHPSGRLLDVSNVLILLHILILKNQFVRVQIRSLTFHLLDKIIPSLKGKLFLTIKVAKVITNYLVNLWLFNVQKILLLLMIIVIVLTVQILLICLISKRKVVSHVTVLRLSVRTKRNALN